MTCAVRSIVQAQDIIADWEHQSFNRHRHPVVASLTHNLLSALCDAFDEPAAEQQRQWELEAEESKARNNQEAEPGKSPRSEQASLAAAERCLLNQRIAVLQDHGPVRRVLTPMDKQSLTSAHVFFVLQSLL